MAIDYGGKRTGIAVTDEMQIIASGLTTVETKNIFPFLENYFKTVKVSKIIVGEPKRMNNEASSIGAEINKFVEKLAKLYPQIEIIRMDERRSEEHTSELQSRENLVCRLLLEKKK